jgi:hypothetical protein
MLETRLTPSRVVFGDVTQVLDIHDESVTLRPNGNGSTTILIGGLDRGTDTSHKIFLTTSGGGGFDFNAFTVDNRFAFTDAAITTDQFGLRLLRGLGEPVPDEPAGPPDGERGRRGRPGALRRRITGPHGARLSPKGGPGRTGLATNPPGGPRRGAGAGAGAGGPAPALRAGPVPSLAPRAGVRVRRAE